MEAEHELPLPEPLGTIYMQDESEPCKEDRSPINNGGSDPNSGMRRSGGSANDPHGGYENIDTERRGPDPDPVDELVPGGQGATKRPTKD
jgi:hypothetical protein